MCATVFIVHLLYYINCVLWWATGVHTRTQEYTEVHRSTQEYTREHRNIQRYTGIHRSETLYTECYAVLEHKIIERSKDGLCIIVEDLNPHFWMPGSLRAADTPNARCRLWSKVLKQTDAHTVSLSTVTSGPNFTNDSGSHRNTSLPSTTVPPTSSIVWIYGYRVQIQW